MQEIVRCVAEKNSEDNIELEKTIQGDVVRKNRTLNYLVWGLLSHGIEELRNPIWRAVSLVAVYRALFKKLRKGIPCVS